MPNKSKKSSPRKSPRKPQHNLSPTDPGTPLSLAGGSSSTSPGEISPIGSSTPEKSSPRKSPRKPQHNFSPTDPGTHLSLAGGSSSTSPGEISPIGSSTPEKSSPRKSQHNLSLTDPGTPLFRAGGSSSTSPGEISPPIGSVTPVTAESNLEQAERSLKELSKKGVFDEESERTSTASPAHPPGAGSFESADFEHTHPDLAHPAHHNTVDHPDHSTTAATPSKPIATAPSSSKSKLNPTVPPFHCPSSPKLNPAAPSFHRPNSPTRIRYIGGHADITPPPETVHKVPSHPHPHQEGETEQRPTTKVRYTHSGIVLGPKQGERHPKMAHYDGTEGGTEEYMEKEEDNGMDDERDKEHGKEEVRDNLDENGLKEEGKAVEEMKKNLDENGLKEEGKAMEEMKKNLDENGLKEEGKAMEEMKKNLDENGLKDEKEDEHMVKKEYGKQEGGKKVEENGKQKGNSWADIAAPSSGGMVHEGDQVDISADVPLGEVVGVKPEYEKENEEKKERKESWADIASAEVHEGEKLDISSTNPPTTTTSSSNPASSSKPPIGPYQAKPKASSSHKLHVKAPISPTSTPPLNLKTQQPRN
ncbi:Protein of unknown function [Pyronema omphalodes CBS 100304]|uniref:Uncharacterized protein n=1 Tax=Pyronema omphalodes (strain CBS 100304) TaxID=1076935 RepID=U4L0Z3_PYROM|nr:Protein of unknown function [Pyronema omphalodes CBS 100304]